MSRTVWIVLALITGLGAGIVLRAAGPSGLGVAEAIRPIGQLWLNALQMTLTPLVFCLMTVGVAGAARAAGTGRLVAVALAAFIGLLFAGSMLGAAAAEGFLALWPVHAIRSAPALSALTTNGSPSLVSEILTLVPTNPVAAAAQSAMTPLIVFAAFFGAAISRLSGEDGDRLIGFFRAAGDALLTIVGWVLRLAPLGIFVLAVGAAASVGLAAAGGLIQYALLLSAVLALGVVAALGLGLASGVGPGRFLRAVAAPAALAASTQSSMACLPALVKAAQEDLGLPPALVGVLMPMAVTVFRFGNVVGGVSAGLIGARLFGIDPGLPQIILAICVGVLTNIGVMGLPGPAVLLASYGPIFIALGAPIEALFLLLAVDTLPDILDTTANVTADLAVTAIIGRVAKRVTEPQPS